MDVLLPVMAPRRPVLFAPGTPILLDGALFRLEDDVTVGGVTGPNPLLRNSNTGGAYDEQKAGPRTVRRESATSYKMWWEGIKGGSPLVSSTCYATGPNGIDWTKYGSNPVMSPAVSPSWENSEFPPTTVLWDGTQYVLYGHGGNNASNRQIGRATSPDGISWTKYAGNPVLAPGGAGAWDAGWVSDCKVVRLSASEWVMLYGGRTTATNPLGKIGRATSPDGITWTKDAGNPVLGPTGAGWEAGGVFAPSAPIIDSNGRWHMWYVGGDSPSAAVMALGYAFSDDRGASWTRGANNPVLTVNAESDSPDSAFVGDTLAAWDDGDKVMVTYGAEKTSGTYTGTGGLPIRAICGAYLPLTRNRPTIPARFFLGATDRVALPTSVSLFDNAVYTLVARVKVMRDDTTSRLIYGETLAFNKEINLRVGSGVLAMLHRTPAAFASIQGSARVDDNTWHNVAIRRNGASSFDLIADGAVLVSSSAAVGTTADTGNPAYGNWAASVGLNEPLQGTISRIALWDAAALTLAEITAFLTNGTLPAAGMPSWWHDPGSGATEPDKSGNAKTGTPTGTTVVDGDPLAGVTPTP